MAELEISTDEIGLGKVLVILFYLFITLIILWFSANYPEEQATATWYFGLSMFGLIMITMDLVIKKAGGIKIPDVPNTIIWEKGPLFAKFGKRWPIIMVGVAAAFAVGNFFLIGSHTITQIVAAPTFQAVELGSAGTALMSGLAGISENMIFIYFLPATIFALIAYFTKNPILALILAILISMPTFAVYHFLRYGTAQITNTVNVAIMAGIWTTIAFLTRNTLISDAWHFSNNAAIIYWSSVGSSAITLWIGMIGMFAILAVTGIAAMKVSSRSGRLIGQ